MNDNQGSLRMFDQEKLRPEVRDAALVAAHTVLSRGGVSADEAVRAYGVDLLLAEFADGEDPTDEHYREHGATLHALEGYYAAKEAAEDEIAKLDPANAGFVVLFSLVR